MTSESLERKFSTKLRLIPLKVIVIRLVKKDRSKYKLLKTLDKVEAEACTLITSFNSTQLDQLLPKFSTV